MSSPFARTGRMLRQTRSGPTMRRTAGRRFESTATTQAPSAKAAAETAKSTADKVAGAAKESGVGKDSAAKAQEAAAKASAAASEYAAKASQGLSRVASAAGPVVAGAAKKLSNSLGQMGGRTGQVVAFVEKQIPHVVYYAKVGLEMGKIIFHGQKMTPPSLETFQKYFQNVYKNPSVLLQTASETASKASQSPANVLNMVRNISRAQLAAGGVVAAECLGFFTFGEMIGRFKVVGYHGEGSAAEH